MKVQAIQTHRVEVGASLLALVDRYVPVITEGSVLAITSKVVSVCQGRVIDQNSIAKEALIRQEADAVAQGVESPYGIVLAIKEGILLPSAGIDESNADHTYILYPANVQDVAVELWHHLRQRHRVKRLGVLITDSHTTPMRRGVMGIALGWCGFAPLHSYVGKPDLYGRPLRVSQANVLDALAAAAVFVMGEGSEQTPLALLQDLPQVTFMDQPPIPAEVTDIRIPMHEDLYAPLLMGVQWAKPAASEE
ncbi:MAG: coenzyme F420-0:L-glutamate ligase [Bacteroidota bacterium]